MLAAAGGRKRVRLRRQQMQAPTVQGAEQYLQVGRIVVHQQDPLGMVSRCVQTKMSTAPVASALGIGTDLRCKESHTRCAPAAHVTEFKQRNLSLSSPLEMRTPIGPNVPVPSERRLPQIQPEDGAVGSRWLHTNAAPHGLN